MRSDNIVKDSEICALVVPIGVGGGRRKYNYLTPSPLRSKPPTIPMFKYCPDKNLTYPSRSPKRFRRITDTHSYEKGHEQQYYASSERPDPFSQS